MNTFLTYDLENNKNVYYKIYTCKDKWNKKTVRALNDVIPYLDSIFEDNTIYRIIKHNIDHDVGIRTIFNKADLEDFRSEVYHKQLEQDKILQKYYEFKKRGK